MLGQGESRLGRPQTDHIRSTTQLLRRIWTRTKVEVSGCFIPVEAHAPRTVGQSPDVFQQSRGLERQWFHQHCKGSMYVILIFFFDMNALT